MLSFYQISIYAVATPTTWLVKTCSCTAGKNATHIRKHDAMLGCRASGRRLFPAGPPIWPARDECQQVGGRRGIRRDGHQRAGYFVRAAAATRGLQQQGWPRRCKVRRIWTPHHWRTRRAVASSADAPEPRLHRGAQRAAAEEAAPERSVLLTAATMGVAAGSGDAERSRQSWLDAHTMLLDDSRLRAGCPATATTVGGCTRSSGGPRPRRPHPKPCCCYAAPGTAGPGAARTHACRTMQCARSAC